MEMGFPHTQQNQFLKTRGRISVSGSACHNGEWGSSSGALELTDVSAVPYWCWAVSIDYKARAGQTSVWAVRMTESSVIAKKIYFQIRNHMVLSPPSFYSHLKSVPVQEFSVSFCPGARAEYLGVIASRCNQVLQFSFGISSFSLLDIPITIALAPNALLLHCFPHDLQHSPP